jgi:hypothetical protein
MTATVAKACDPFDFDPAWAALPPPTICRASATSHGAAGRRLRGHLKASLPDVLLQEFARDQLGARRLSAAYLDALRVTVGNQARAERYGYVLELNIRVDFATERVMRNIIDQMQAAGITSSKRVSLGGGCTQVVQVFRPARKWRLDLNTMLRWEESGVSIADLPGGITAADVPY